MSEDTQQDHISKKVVVYRISGMDDVQVERDVVYRATDAAGTLTMDLYYPPDGKRAEQRPAVVIVAGYSDLGLQSMLGGKFKEMGFSTSWARLMAASGIVAIVYTNREPAADLHALLAHVKQHAAALGVDEARIGVWASSGNVPLALSVLMQNAGYHFACAALCYGFMLDLDGSTWVAEASKQWGFVNAAAGHTVDDLPSDLPLFVARAGRDAFPHLNDGLDRFVAKALARNLPVTVTNHSVAPHAFDLLHDSETSREIVRQLLGFMRCHLAA
jgi:hypothetical protein